MPLSSPAGAGAEGRIDGSTAGKQRSRPAGNGKAGEFAHNEEVDRAPSASGDTRREEVVAAEGEAGVDGRAGVAAGPAAACPAAARPWARAPWSSSSLTWSW